MIYLEKFMLPDSVTEENALYILDEPENNLFVKLQTELKRFIIDSMRGFKCQFVIATHSSFMLSIPGIKNYDFDSTPPQIKEWTELASMWNYYELFMSIQKSFERFSIEIIIRKHLYSTKRVVHIKPYMMKSNMGNA